MASRLGVSRTPVREAFQSLAADGLITLRMNKGAIVNRIDRKFIKDTFEMRILLEGTAAARAAANGMEVSELLTRLYHMRDNLSNLVPSDYTSLNQDIHMSIWNAADNFKLKSYLMELWNGPSTGRYGRSYFPQYGEYFEGLSGGISFYSPASALPSAFPSLLAISSTSSFSITRGGTKRMTLTPALISTSFSPISASFTTGPTGQVSSRP